MRRTFAFSLLHLTQARGPTLLWQSTLGPVSVMRLAVTAVQQMLWLLWSASTPPTVVQMALRQTRPPMDSCQVCYDL